MGCRRRTRRQPRRHPGLAGLERVAEPWPGTHHRPARRASQGSTQERGPVGDTGGAHSARAFPSQGKGTPSVHRQDRSLEKAYRKNAEARAKRDPEAKRVSRSSFLRNRQRAPKSRRLGKGQGKASRADPPNQSLVPHRKFLLGSALWRRYEKPGIQGFPGQVQRNVRAPRLKSFKTKTRAGYRKQPVKHWLEQKNLSQVLLFAHTL